MSEQPDPLFSVVMPALNAAGTVGAAMGSVLQQSLDSFELLVVDDGSTDATAEIVRRIGDPRVRLIQRDHGGAAAARNAGIAAARGGIVSFVDSDDLLMPRFLAVMKDTLDARPDAGFAHTDAYMLDAATGRIRRTPVMALDRPSPWPQSAEELNAALLEGNFLYNAVSIPRSVFDRVGGFDESLRAAIDYEMWLRITAHGLPAVQAPGILAIYRWGRPDSISSNRERVFSNLIRVYEIAAESHPGSEQARALALRRRATVVAELSKSREGRTPRALLRRGRDALARIRHHRRSNWYEQSEVPAELSGAFPELMLRGS